MREKILNIGTLFSAILASACCWLPLLFLIVGVSGVAVSATLEEYRPFFLALTFSLLGIAFYFAYRPQKAKAANQSQDCCAESTDSNGKPSEGACCTPADESKSFNVHKLNKIMLWVVTAVAVVFAFFPNYVGLFLSESDALATNGDLQKIFLNVDRMTCQGCAANVQHALKAIPEVAAVEVNYEDGEAIIGVPVGKEVPREEILEAVSKLGFKGSFPK